MFTLVYFLKKKWWKMVEKIKHICYNIGVAQIHSVNPKRFLLPHSLKGAVCQCGYSSEQVNWATRPSL
jgi:hypothetical protein